jgi:DNA-binding beta-propeller fold protein YncE
MFSMLGFSVLAITLLSAAQAGHQGNSLMAVRADGKALALACTDAGKIAALDAFSMQPLWETGVGSRPEGTTFVGPGKEIAATVYDEDLVVILDGEKGSLRFKIPVEDEPYGIISNGDGSRLYVSHEYPGKVSEIDPSAGKVLRVFDAGSRPRGIALHPDGKTLFVTEFLSATMHAIDLAHGKRIDTWKGQPSDNLARQLTIHPKRPKAYVPHIRSRTGVIDGTGSIFPQLTVYDLVPPSDQKRRKSFGMDTFNGVYVVTNPWETALTSDGKKLLALYSGTDDMNVCQVVDDDYKEIERSGRGIVRVGKNPRAVRISPDDAFAYVHDSSDYAVRKLDLKTMNLAGTAQLSKPNRSEEWIRGRFLWNSADSPMSSRRWVACSSCHPDGQPDGRVWNNPEGKRKTPHLGGLAHTHPLHWSADRDEVQDFEYTIRSKLMLGPGLLRESIKSKQGFNKTELGEKTSGRSGDLDALAIYTNSFTFNSLSPHALGEGKLTEQALRGKSLFSDAKVGCATCHSGPFFSDSNLAEMKLHDVGTGRGDSSERMGTRYDTPTLLGVYRTAPYLHDGSAATLKEVLTTANAGDSHGVTSHLEPGQIDDLVAFLQSLPYEKVPDTTKNTVKYLDSGGATPAKAR